MNHAREANTIEVPLRWRDLDYLGHVYHGTMLTLLDEARSKWFGCNLGLENATDYVVARVEIDFLKETPHGEGSVQVQFALERLGTKSLTTSETVLRADGEIVAQASVVVVLWNSNVRESRSISPAERGSILAACHLPQGTQHV